jgi:hypothetical protein
MLKEYGAHRRVQEPDERVVDRGCCARTESLFVAASEIQPAGHEEEDREQECTDGERRGRSTKPRRRLREVDRPAEGAEHEERQHVRQRVQMLTARRAL